VSDHEETLRKLAVRDDAYVDRLLSDGRASEAASALDRRTSALVQIGALIALDATPPSYMDAVEEARTHGASCDEIAGCLVAVLPTVGVARVVSAAPKLALALGYDVDAALELVDAAANR
jgi:alkylhydroperoxidase/carboxymuconolactone decarboxylase family protein YurZ